MHTQNSRRLQLWLLTLTALSAALLGFIIVWFAGNGVMPSERRRVVLGANDATPTTRGVRQSPTANPLTPTFVPLPAELTPSAFPTPANADEPPTELPIESAPPIVLPAPTKRPSTPPVQPTPRPPVPIRADGSQVRLEDTVWQGGFRQARGYGGRSATWVYGSGTAYSTMTAAVTLERQPQGTAVLRVEGMDSEGRAKTPILITVNGQPIFQGPNPLPDDDLPLESGTWDDASWTFNAALLRPGQNTIRIRNLAAGAVGRPPFFMLDFADLILDDQAQPQPAPTDEPAPPPEPTDEPAPPPEPVPPTPELPTAEPTPGSATAEIRLEDTAWQGGYGQGRSYGGRTATWIYGSGTAYSTMTAAVTLERQPQGSAVLRVEGMDSEGRAKTPIRITVNGQPIFQGPNPLPDDDLPLESGTWATASWTFDAALLQPGQNTIQIRNLADGAVGRPPFFMLDYAVLVVP